VEKKVDAAFGSYQHLHLRIRNQANCYVKPLCWNA